MAKANWLKNLFVKEVSLVDRPANPEAVVVLTKRAESDEEYIALSKRKWTADERKEAERKGWAMPGGRYPIETVADLENAIHAVGRGKGSHADIRAHIMRRARALGAEDRIPDSWKVSKILAETRAMIAKSGLVAAHKDAADGDGAESFDDTLAETKLTQAVWQEFYSATDALRESICSILEDGSVSDKKDMIMQSINEFADYLRGAVPGDVGKSLAERISAHMTGAAGSTLRKEEEMSEALKKALGLPATATDEDVLAALAKRDEEIKKLKTDLSKAAMSDKHKAFHAKLKGDEKDKFAAMSPEERDKMIAEYGDDDGDEQMAKAVAKGDAFKTKDGHVFHKRDFGSEAAYQFAKSQAETIAKQAEEIAKAREEKTAAEFAKRAKDAFGDEAFGAVLRKAYAGDAAAQADVEKRIIALRKQADAGAIFTEKGGRGSPAAGTAEAELLAKRDELRKSNPSLTPEQAFAKVYEDRANAEIVKRYKAEQGLPV